MSYIEDYRMRAARYFRRINDLSMSEVETAVRELIMCFLPEEIGIIDVLVSGSRIRGMEHPGSDVDIILFYTGSWKEDALFNLLHEDSFLIAGVEVDINPIRKEEHDFKAYLEAV